MDTPQNPSLLASDMKVADLHLHTRYSDGTYTPEELAGHAAAVGLDAVALTDHDTVAGCAPMAAACAGRGLEFIPGSELTADLEGREFHVLGYWLDAGSALLQARLAEFQAARIQRIHDMVDRLNHRGIGLTADAVLAVANCGSPGRPHVARALVEGGHCRNYDDAFERFLKKGRPAWVPKVALTMAETIQLIHAAGGAAVLAHPGLYRSDPMIPGIAALGLDGLECWHTRHSATASESYARTAARLGLVATGGSDCHGMAKGEPLIGRIRLPYAQVTALKARRPVAAAAA
ncbi:MAG: PHP domain-containing protein [Verrucomicrobia bacterium]|nr:PHP domain-containing protein [Verrucomicrobiota bacterium]